MILYISLQVLLFYKVKLWDFSLLKDTIYWIIGSALVLLINIANASKEQDYFKKILLKNLTILVILEFILNLYTFPFIVEMIVLPFITIFYLIAIVSENNKAHLSIKNTANSLVAIYGFVILIFSLVNVVSDFDNFWTLNNLKDFILPILLSISFVSFLYLLALYFAYESLFIRLEINIKKDKSTVSYAKKSIFALCCLNLMKLNRFNRKNALILHRFSSKEEVRKIINDFKLAN
jgi:hypothetical protein